MNRKFTLAIVGATGAVGDEMLRVLEESDFPAGDLRLFASDDSADRFLDVRGEPVMVTELTAESFEGVDIAIFCAGEECSRDFCSVAAAAGAVCIDLSAAWRMDPEVPLVVPEINPGEIRHFRNRGIVASPASSTVLLSLPLKALHDFSPLRRVVVSTYRSVAGSGAGAVDDLRIQCGELLNGRPAEAGLFPHQIAFNCLPQTSGFLDNGYTAEEMSIAGEVGKILGEGNLRVTATAVHVPVFYGDCAALNVETAGKINPAKARELFASFAGIEVIDDPAEKAYPMPVDAAGEDSIFIGRIREDESIDNGLNLWVAGDGLRKGSATNAVQIARLLAEDYL